MPTGSSGFADDTPQHTDGPDAAPAKAILVTKTADYLQWAGMDTQTSFIIMSNKGRLPASGHGHTSEKMSCDRHGYAKWSAGGNRQFHSTWATLPSQSSQSVA